MRQTIVPVARTVVDLTLASGRTRPRWTPTLSGNAFVKGHTVMRRRSPAVLAGIAALVTAGAAGVVAALPASAAVGCSVQYTVVNQWPGGFGTNVVIRNIGD